MKRWLKDQLNIMLMAIPVLPEDLFDPRYTEKSLRKLGWLKVFITPTIHCFRLFVPLLIMELEEAGLKDVLEKRQDQQRKEKVENNYFWKEYVVAWAKHQIYAYRVAKVGLQTLHPVDQYEEYLLEQYILRSRRLISSYGSVDHARWRQGVKAELDIYIDELSWVIWYHGQYPEYFLHDTPPLKFIYHQESIEARIRRNRETFERKRQERDANWYDLSEVLESEMDIDSRNLAKMKELWASKVNYQRINRPVPYPDIFNQAAFAETIQHIGCPENEVAQVVKNYQIVVPLIFANLGEDKILEIVTSYRKRLLERDADGSWKTGVHRIVDWAKKKVQSSTPGPA